MTVLILDNLNAGAEMANLIIRKVRRDCETRPFLCGNPSIEQRIKHSYFASLLQEGYGYEIVLSDKIIGYYMIAVTILNGVTIPDDCASGIFQNARYAAVEITYLAIDKSVQGRGVGTVVLKAILKNVRSWCDNIPIRYVIIDALQEKVSWYKARGFYTISDHEDNAPTVKMFVDCLVDEEKLKAYISDEIS